ncbi:MAG: glycosyltransferase family 39 protein [Bacteroidetes bacterium]|nr:glycosyltransferase family 39 protein [Bacteroidota bacterium]
MQLLKTGGRLDAICLKFSDSPFLLALLFLVTLALRLLYLNFYPLNIDEPFTVFYSQMSLSNIGEMLKTENNPPLFFILLHYWIKLFGISEFSVRFLPALFSALTVIFIYKIGSDFFSNKIAWASSFLFIFSESHFEFAHDCRAYSLLVFLSLLSMYLLLILIKRNAGNGYWILFCLVNSLLIYTHFIGWIVILVQISLLLIEFNAASLKKFGAVFSINFLLLLPYLPIFIRRIAVTTKFGTWVTAPTYEDLYIRLWDYSNKPFLTVLFISIFTLGSLQLIVAKKRTSIQIKALLMLFFIPYLGLFLVSQKIPLFIERYLLIISLPFYILICVFIEEAASKRKGFSLLFILLPLCMLVTSNFNPNRKRPNKQLVELLSHLKNDSTALLINPDWYEATFLYYYDKTIFKEYSSAKMELNKRGIFPLSGSNSMQKLSLEKYHQIIYFQSNSNLVDTANATLECLKGKYKFIATKRVYDCNISILIETGAI